MQTPDKTRLGIEWSDGGFQLIPATDPRKPKFILKKLLAQYVWDITQLEDNPMSFLDVQTVLDGITVGGYKTEDFNQALNQAKALRELSNLVGNPEWSLSKKLATHLHSFVAREEALAWGEFRKGAVGISGTSYQPPPPELLDTIYESGINEIKKITNPVEKAVIYFFWASLNQFFYDGNKRTGRLVMNYLLMNNGYYYLTVPAEKKEEFNSGMVDFYNTRNADGMIRFMRDCYKNWD